MAPEAISTFKSRLWKAFWSWLLQQNELTVICLSSLTFHSGIWIWKVIKASHWAGVRAPLMKGEDMRGVFTSRCATLGPLLTTLEPYLASPLNSPLDILFIKSFHTLLCNSTVPLYILLLSEVSGCVCVSVSSAAAAATVLLCGPECRRGWVSERWEARMERRRKHWVN